jgi:hypothetical protein
MRTLADQALDLAWALDALGVVINKKRRFQNRKTRT